MKFRSAPLVLSACLAGLAALAGCSSEQAAQPTPTPTVSPAPGPATVLAALARAGRDAAYTATYRLRSARGSDTVVVRRSPPSYRLDITVRGEGTAILVKNRSGLYSCQNPRKGRTTCIKLADKNREPPKRYARAATAGQDLFTVYLDTLARVPDDYIITEESAEAARGSVPAASCFHIEATEGLRRPVVAEGSYCFSAVGVVTRAEFESGSYVLRALRGPPKQRLAPPVRATPLPRN